MCAHRNSDNLHNAVFFIGYSLVARVMVEEHLIVVLHQQGCKCSTSVTGSLDDSFREPWSEFCAIVSNVGHVHSFYIALVHSDVNEYLVIDSDGRLGVECLP